MALRQPNETKERWTLSHLSIFWEYFPQTLVAPQSTPHFCMWESDLEKDPSFKPPQPCRSSPSEPELSHISYLYFILNLCYILILLCSVKFPFWIALWDILRPICVKTHYCHGWKILYVRVHRCALRAHLVTRESSKTNPWKLTLKYIILYNAMCLFCFLFVLFLFFSGNLEGLPFGFSRRNACLRIS